ncbi:MAG TPA: hypothetical protein VE669_12595 [Actinomycetota bacterium]|nr:hypothetical protein [Actinomycetota bacterium]
MAVRRTHRLHRWGPRALVALVVLFNLWVLRAEATPVQNLNDGAVHRSMIGWAQDRWADGHLPLDGWYPYLGLGASRFHHYQSLPHVLTGLGALGIGSHRAYSWSLYLLLSLWPISVFVGGRLLGLGRWRSAVAALASPLIASAPTLGYEWGSYAWRGYGTWTQLWGMWLLPLAWGTSFRAISRGRQVPLAAFVVAMTVAVHLLTGYLALLSLGVLVLLRPTRLPARLARGLLVGVGAVLIAAWVAVPLLADRAFTIQDEFSRNRVYYDSFGAGQVLRWMVTGQLFDRGRIPVLSILVALGLLVALFRWRRDERGRAVIVLGLLSLLLFFGRPTLGPVLRVLPGSGDLFLRRYISGVHLAGLYLVGMGAVRLGRWLPRVAGWALRRHAAGWRRPGVVLAVLVAALLVALSPAWIERRAWAATGARWIHEQELVDATEGRDVEELVDLARANGPGRMYAGLRANWGSTYRVGQVPVYAMLLNLDVQAVGFTRPTWSLSSPFEFRFRDTDRALYDLFDVRYLILPADRDPPVEAALLARRGGHTLWEVPVDGAIEVVDTTTPIVADRTDLGVQVQDWLRSDLPDAGVHPSIAFAGLPPAAATLPEGELPTSPPGEVLSSSVDLLEGRASATVRTDRSAMAMLKTSFDNRWRVTVDGRPLGPQMVAPSFVGHLVPEGRHQVMFTYVPYPRYDLLLAVGAATCVGLWLATRRRGVVR